MTILIILVQVSCDIFISDTALLNRCEQFKVCIDIPPTQLCRSEDAKQKFQRIKIKFLPNDFLCSNQENDYPQHMFILSMSADLDIFYVEVTGKMFKKLQE